MGDHYVVEIWCVFLPVGRNNSWSVGGDVGRGITNFRSPCFVLLNSRPSYEDIGGRSSEARRTSLINLFSSSAAKSSSTSSTWGFIVWKTLYLSKAVYRNEIRFVGEIKQALSTQCSVLEDCRRDGHTQAWVLTVTVMQNFRQVPKSLLTLNNNLAVQKLYTISTVGYL